MSSSRTPSAFDRAGRRSLLIGLSAASFALSGCFRPLLAKNGEAQQVRGHIGLPEIDGRFGYFLNQSLEDRLGTPVDPAYRLEVRTQLSDRNLAIAQNNDVTRKTVSAKAVWRLLRVGDNRAVMRDEVTVQSGFNATTSLFATRQTRLDIERRLARDIGERIARKVLARADLLET